MIAIIFLVVPSFLSFSYLLLTVYTIEGRICELQLKLQTKQRDYTTLLLLFVVCLLCWNWNKNKVDYIHWFFEACRSYRLFRPSPRRLEFVQRRRPTPKKLSFLFLSPSLIASDHPRLIHQMSDRMSPETRTELAANGEAKASSPAKGSPNKVLSEEEHSDSDTHSGDSDEGSPNQRSADDSQNTDSQLYLYYF